MVKLQDFIKKNKILLSSVGIVLILALILTVSINVIASKGALADISSDNIVTLNDNVSMSTNLADVSANEITGVGIEITFSESNNIANLPTSGFGTDIDECLTGDCELGEEEDDGYELDYSQLAIADVTNYVNVRSEPNETSEIVGYIYNGAVANIEEKAGENGEWFKINSGNVNGYIKAEFFIAGDAAADVMSDYVTKYATVVCDRLNVRQEESAESKRIGYIENNEKVKVLEDKGDWLLVEYLDDKKGYVSAEFVSVTEEFTYARTLEEDKKIKEEAAALLARETDNSSKSKENLTKYIDTSITPADSFGSHAELRSAMVDYACQFVGLPYVYGGNSLTTGTDCSGFTMLVYKHFGYNISRIPQGQLDGVGRRISYEEIQPGDIVLYSSKGVKATHAALYIGNGKVVHETNHRYGVLITSIDWIGPVWGIKNIID